MKKLILLFAMSAVVQAADTYDVKIKNATSYDKVVGNWSAWVRDELTLQVPKQEPPFVLGINYFSGTNSIKSMGEYPITGNCEFVCRDDQVQIIADSSWYWFTSGFCLSVLFNGFTLGTRLVRRGIFGNVANYSVD